MQELDLDIKYEQVVEVDQKKQLHQKLVGRILPHRNHIIWKFNEYTKKLSRAEFRDEDETLLWKDYENGNWKRRSILIEQNCIYFNALNQKNAIKILRRDYRVVGDIDLVL